MNPEPQFLPDAPAHQRFVRMIHCSSALRRRTGLLPVCLFSLLAMLDIACGDADVEAERSRSDSAALLTDTNAPAPDSNAGGGSEYDVVFDTISRTHSVPGYEVRAAYPQIRGFVNAVIESRFNRVVRDSVNALIRDFTSSVEEAGDLELPEGMESTSSFELEPAVHTADAHTLSVELRAYVYSAGAAHPNSFSTAFNYDLQSGRFIRLADLFDPDFEYLEFIADYCIAELKRRDVSDGDWIERGAGQAIGNYVTFFITSDALVIHFDPYQVAPYAAGPQRIEIPWKEIEGARRT